MVKKIALPFHAVMRRHEMLPIFHRSFHSRRARKRDDGVQVVRHEQTQAAIPDKFFVIVTHGGQNRVAGFRIAKLIPSRRLAFDGDEKPTALGNPLRDGVRQFAADGQIHAANIAKRREKEKPVDANVERIIRKPVTGRARRSARAALATEPNHPRKPLLENQTQSFCALSLANERVRAHDGARGATRPTLLISLPRRRRLPILRAQT